MLMILPSFRMLRDRQRGAAAVEFALVAMLFFTLLLGIIEFGRMFYLYNTVQEVTRRAAREAVVRWVDEEAAVRTIALFGGGNLPGGTEITAANINIEYLNAYDDVNQINSLPDTPADNISACLDVQVNCIAFVRVSITGVTYVPMVAGLFTFLSIPIPASTVTMPAESMGYRL